MDSEIDFLKEITTLSELSGEEKKTFLDKLSQIERSINKEKVDDIVDQEKKKKEQILKNEKELAEKRKKIEEEVAKLALKLSDAIIAKKIKNIDKEKKKLDKEKDIHDKRIDAEAKSEEVRIRQSQMTEEEKEVALAEVQERSADRKLAAEQQLVAQQEALDKKKEDMERTKFYIGQGAALGRIAIDTIEKTSAINLEVLKLTAMAAYQPWLAPLIPIVGAQIPIAVATGAASAALIAGQTLAYADGTPEGGHPHTGPALVGEGGQPELVQFPGQDPFWVAQPTLIPNMQAGTQVWPLDMLDNYLLPQLYGQRITPRGMDTRKLEQQLNKGFRTMTNAIKNKPVADIHIADGVFRKSVCAGNNKINYLKRKLH